MFANKDNYPCCFACTELVFLNPRVQLEQHHIEMAEWMPGMHIKVVY